MKNNFANVKGNARIFSREIAKDKKTTFTVYSVGVSKKKEDGDYVNASLDVRFSKEAQKAFYKLDPTKETNEYTMTDAYIEGWLSVKEGKDGKNYVNLFVNKVAPAVDDDADDADLPF